MKVLELPFVVRWADVDANRHMRHSAYYDYAAHLRVQLLKRIGMDLVTLSKAGIGPVLFREEAVFLREISMDETIRVNVKIKRIREDASHWTFNFCITDSSMVWESAETTRFQRTFNYYFSSGHNDFSIDANRGDSRLNMNIFGKNFS